MFTAEAAPVSLDGDWKKAPGTSELFMVSGTGSRSNPIRRKLAESFSGDQLFISYRLTYPAASLDSPTEGDGEFFVMWLDRAEGNEGSTHSGGVPNIGIHVKDEIENRFMIRYTSGVEKHAAPVNPDREFTVTARLWKSVPGEKNLFDNLDLWIDPKPDEENKPHATIRSTKSIPEVSWIGFSTGRKTEATDRIQIADIRLADTWRSLSGLPDLTKRYEAPPKKPAPPAPEIERVAVKPPPEKIESDHWSFQPISRPDVPESSDWAKNPIDAFVAAKHRELGLTAAPPADDVTFRRRVSLVLTGLPPTGEKLDVEAMLKSQEFGERWGRHWLDVARWAESNGHQHNRDRPYAWKYRDYVVNSFRDDKPYDQFVREQIAGDELEDWDPDHLIATGFLAAARYSGNELDKKIQRNDILVDITNTTSEAFLGLTMACAQCHDHFFDPITAWDYYQMQAFFVNGQPGNVILDGDAVDVVQQRWNLFETVKDRIETNKRRRGDPEPILVIPKSVKSGMTAEEKFHFAQFDKQIAEFPQTWGFYSPSTAAQELEIAPHEMRWPLSRDRDALAKLKVSILDRGDINAPGPEVAPAWPQVFGKTEPVGNRPRLALANWITSPENPLTARVWVNRIWQGYFGNGLVKTSGNFGIEGTDPSHPELLDWLASELIASNWSSRHIHRLILNSATFRQSSQFSAANQDRDSDNAALWRWTPRRLESEAIRDSILAVSGQLDLTPGGPSDTTGSTRRSLYLQQKRDNLPHQQMLFDSPNAVTSCSHRLTSTVALQPLWMLNSQFIQNAAGKISAEDQAPESLIGKIFSRPAEKKEIETLSKLPPADAALVLLNSNEFLYIP